MNKHWPHGKKRKRRQTTPLDGGAVRTRRRKEEPEGLLVRIYRVLMQLLGPLRRLLSSRTV